MKLSLVIPCFNKVENINLFYDSVRQDYNKELDYELIFIDDGSIDDTLTRLKELGKSDKKHVKIISFSRRFGKEASILAGLKIVKGDYVGIIDLDKSQDIKIVLEMLDILEKDDYYDSVVVYQKEYKENKLLSFINNNFNDSSSKFKSGITDVRLCRRKVVDSLLLLEGDNSFLRKMFSWLGFNTYYLPYKFTDKTISSSKFNLFNTLIYKIREIVSFNTNLLEIPMIMGIIFLVLCLLSFIIFILTMNASLGISTLILFISSIQFFVIGIVCEYISQMHIQSKNRPLYIIKEKINIK